ncbi:hypothetical protein FHW84_003439 [Dyella sp. SG562]|uniref:hypothetical protein n=1 Tax=Dyella sp. SG562 TaxID=2587017 RepID=UPI001421AB7D|nr:hypothetical protein [Dyella sp. SG562]NII74843.1 hypothetical protein [Dyella sp. SG562]
MSFLLESDQKNTPEARLSVALAFLDAHAAQHLDEAQLITRCTAAVMERFAVSQRTANHDALHALAATQARNEPAYVDINHSTSHVIYVTSARTGRLIAFTASELISLADERRATAQDAEYTTARCGRRADR